MNMQGFVQRGVNMTTLVLVWLLLVGAIIFTTFVLLLWLSEQPEDSENKWRPPRAYKWDATD